MSKEYPTSIRLDEQMKKDLEKLAARENRSIANYIKHILKKVIEKGGKI